MKVKISREGKPLQGYLNIDPCPQTDKDNDYNILRKGLHEIDNDLLDAECSEITVDYVLESLHWERVFDFVQILCKKLSHNGNIIIVGTDLHSVIHGYCNGELTTPGVNNLLFGDGKTVWSFKNSQISMVEVVEILVNNGIVIKEQSYTQNYGFIVKGYRP